MSDASATEDRRLQAEIDELRSRFSDTQELYREVCTLLFFRRGIAPTANKRVGRDSGKFLQKMS